MKSEEKMTKPDRDVRKTTLPKPADGEVGGPQGPEPTRYGDWAIKGRVSDF